MNSTKAGGAILAIMLLGCSAADVAAPISAGKTLHPRHLIACEDDPDCEDLNTGVRYYGDDWASADGSTYDSYHPVYEQGQGPQTPDGQPIVLPNSAEISLFQNEAHRLQAPTNGLCHALGQTLGLNIGAVRMFGKAVWSRSPTDPTRRGFVTAFYVPASGMLGISRRLPDATPQGQVRSDADLLRSLRHEFAHVRGSPDLQGSNRTAEEWAEMCS